MANNYPNLPGVNIDVKDGQLATTTLRSANSILIIAEARTGRVVPEGPVYISNEQDLYDNFGGFFFQGRLNPIAAQWLTAYKAGVSNIYLMALSGAEKKEQFVDLHNKLFDTVADLSISHVVLDGLYADEEITGLTIDDFGSEVTIEEISLPTAYLFRGKPVEKGAEIEGGEEGVNLKVTPNEGAEAINVTFKPGPINITRFNAELEEALSIYSLDLAGNLTRNTDGSYSLGFNAPVAIEGTEVLRALGLTDAVSSETIIGSPASLLATFAESVSQEMGGTIAYIGTSSPASYDLKGIKNHVDKLMRINTQISPYLQIVAGPEVGLVVPGSLRRQWVSGVTHYAVLVNSTLPQFAPTNRPLLNANQLRYGFSMRQLNELVGHKYVTFHTKNNQIRVVDAVTTAPDLAIGEDTIKSDFTRISTLRIMNYMVGRIHVACEAFIGAPNEFYNYNGMNTAIRAELDDAVQRGIIQDATYSIRLGDSLDTAEVSLNILPQFELRTINVTVALSRPETFGLTQ